MTLLPKLLWFLDGRTALVCLCIFLAVYWLFGTRRSGLPPGPWGFPLVGSAPNIGWGVLVHGLEPHGIFEKYAQKYGPVFQIRVFGKTLVILNDFTSVKDAFQNPKLNDRPQMVLANVFNSKGVAVLSGEPWLELRRFSLTILRSLGVGKSSFEEKIGTEAEEVLKEMTKYDGKPFSPKPLLGNAVSNVICSVIFGKRYEYSDREFRTLLALIARLIKSFGAGGAVNLFPSLRYLPFVKMDEIMGDFQKIESFIRKIVDAHRADLDPDNPKDFTDAYLIDIQKSPGNDATEEHTGPRHKTISRGHIGEQNLVGTIANLFVAGTETTATTLEWCLLYMMAYPEVQERIHAEIDAVVGCNRLPRLTDKPELNFTQAVIWEVQRLNTIAPLGIAHSSASDTQLNGFVIPKGSLIMANLWAVSRDPKVWPEPDRFKPERFLTNDGKAFKADELIPFSIGRRSCIGEHLAKMEIFIFFSYLMHQFTFKKPDNSPPLTLKGKGGITYSPVPFDICAITRD